MNRLILMLQFFTRIPINKEVPVEPEDFRGGSIFFPVVGLVVGLINLAVYYLARHTGNYMFAAILAVLSWASITGALHLDGLSDTCDGIFSSRTKDKMLEIMKDSRIGAMGALSLIFAVFVKISLIWGLSYSQALYTLIIAPVIARTSMLYGITIAKYPREKGLGQTFIGNVTIKEFSIGLIICSIIVFPLAKLYTLVLLFMVFAVPMFFNDYFEKKLGGMTGDTLGALCEIQEILCMLVITLLSNNIWR
ncbi:cobalamin synthase [Oxobacter pfennigii]|uniref:Adenosylcobinamide-GDP ribazoletransferase n=1 Tax=Oxobacter pfennigii TaxID=36849 RepID=A0A0P8WDX3_9CLOT|nr:adenosylcobinamide-GDP ribazoletransferase [Oxobacter pfennigii]KPU46275.1 cobalamin synthase [Oxobacter pfennigii]